MKTSTIIATATSVASLVGSMLTTAGCSSAAPAAPIKNIAIVHGAFADGSGWRGVYDELTARGYHVSIVQNPLTSLADDVAATERVLQRQDGPTILVGHSYGGTVITEAGVDPKVAGLVYVSAFAPDVGETTGGQSAQIPTPPGFVIDTQPDGYGFINSQKFKSGFAGDTTDADAAFMRDSQVPLNMAIFDTKVANAAWHAKPSWAVVATEDDAIDPRLLRQMANRIHAVTQEVPGSHVAYETHPKEVADAIDQAAHNAPH